MPQEASMGVPWRSGRLSACAARWRHQIAEVPMTRLILRRVIPATVRLHHDLRWRGALLTSGLLLGCVAGGEGPQGPGDPVEDPAPGLRADLSAGPVLVADQVRVDSILEMLVEVRNGGTRGVEAGWIVRVMLSTDAVIDSADIQVDHFSAPRDLPPGGQDQYLRHKKLRASTPYRPLLHRLDSGRDEKGAGGQRRQQRFAISVDDCPHQGRGLTAGGLTGRARQPACSTPVPGASDLRPHRGRHLVRSGSPADSGRGASCPAIMQITGVHRPRLWRGMTCRLTSRGARSSP